jgi:hypothetical protein
MARQLRWPRDPRFLVQEDGVIVGPRGLPLTPFPDRQGYPRINVYRAGRHSQHFVHVIVCETFHGLRPEGHEVAHRNGVKTDTRSANLRWTLHAENEADKVTHDRRAWGERHGQAKLSEEDVRAIRSASIGSYRLAKLYPVSAGQIRAIRAGRAWRHVR